MTKLFLTLLNMSISASWVVLAVAALRLVLKKAPNAMRCALWALVAVRLLCPFSFESRLSLMPQLVTENYLTAVADTGPGEIAAPYSYSAEIPVPTQPMEMDTDFHLAVPSSGGSGQAAGPEKRPAASKNWLTVCSILWAVGMAVMFTYAALSYLHVSRKVKASIDLGSGVYLCDYIASPFILGLVKPKIYLPSALEPKDASYVLAHERAHLKRRDHWWKPLGFALLAVYWFNPLLWFAYVLLCRDIELACDERVVKDMAPTDKKAYSEALLNCSVPRHMVAACPLAFGEVSVKARVKSVLNYQKPGFWVVLAAAVAVVVVGMCFLTDPTPNTLSDFFRVSNNMEIAFDLWTRKGIAHLTSQKELDVVWDVLDTVSYGSSPVAEKDDTDFAKEIGFGQYGVELIHDEESVWLWFSRDCTVVQFQNIYWWEEGNPDAQSDFYTVKNPEKLLALFTKYVDPVSRREVTADAFATVDEPWEWMHNVSLDAVRSAKTFQYHENNVNGNIMITPQFEELLNILNGIPEDALSDYAVISENSLDRITAVYTSDPNLCFVIEDRANEIGVVIRYYEEPEIHLEIVMCQDLDAFLSQSTYIQQAQKWEISDEHLLQYMQEFIERPTWITVTAGYWLDWEETPMTVSHGLATIQAERIQGWEYEAVEYQEGAESFGIRCRPGDVDEGWLYISFWPEGYSPLEENRFYNEGSSSGYRYVTSFPAAPNQDNVFDSSAYPFSYSKTEFPVGDYAIINDGADAWFQAYRDHIDAQIAYSTFTYGTALGTGTVRAYGSVTVDFSEIDEYSLGYFDWEKIAGELGATELTLFDPQKYENLLFVAGKYGEKYAVLAFQKEENNGYEYVGCQKPENPLTFEGETCGFRTHYSGENTELALCLIDNEAVTGIECCFGYQDYIHIDRCPALVVLDKANWGEILQISFDLRGDDPPALAFDVTSALQFHAPEDDPKNSKYLYYGFVMYSDGAMQSGYYLLESEEMAQLAELLTSLPQGTFVRSSAPATRPAIGDKFVFLHLQAGDGLAGSNGEVCLALDYDGENVTLTATLTQNHHPWEQPEIVQSFQVQNDLLNPYLESLIDPGRNISSMQEP